MFSDFFFFLIKTERHPIILPAIHPWYENGWFTDSAPPPLYVISTVDDQNLINTEESTAWHLQSVFKYHCLMFLGTAGL